MANEPQPHRGDGGELPAVGRRELLRGTAAVAGGVVLGGLFQSAPALAAPVIYNPFSGYRITDGWQEHLDRGSAGGVDFAMSVGTNLPACGAGTISNIPNNGTGGHTVTINHLTGTAASTCTCPSFCWRTGPQWRREPSSAGPAARPALPAPAPRRGRTCTGT